jgi:hypothetical protein
MESILQVREQPAPPSINYRWLWPGRAATLLAAVVTGFAIGEDILAIPILVIYFIVFALLLAKRPSPLGYGMQLAIGIALGGAGAVFLPFFIFAAEMVVKNFVVVIGEFGLAVLVNLLLIPLALFGRSRLLREGKFYLGFVLALTVLCSCLYSLFTVGEK